MKKVQNLAIYFLINLKIILQKSPQKIYKTLILTLNMKSNKNLLAAILLVLTPFLFAKEESSLQGRLEDNLNRTPTIQFNINYTGWDNFLSNPVGLLGSEAEYFTNSIYTDSRKLYITNSNIIQQKSPESEEVFEVINGIETKRINSDEQYIQEAMALNTNQQLILLGVKSMLFNKFNYEAGLKQSLSERDIVFDIYHQSLQKGGSGIIPIGDCRNITTDIARDAEKLGMEASSVSTEFHQINLIRTKEGKYAIVDGGIFVIDSENIEEILGRYDSHTGRIAIEHKFSDNSITNYILTTKFGKRFLNAIGYDKTLETSRQSLLEHKAQEPRVSVEFDTDGKSNLVDGSYEGFFFKQGILINNQISAIDEMSLFQVGFDRNFSVLDSLKLFGFNQEVPILNYINIHPNTSMLYGIITNEKEKTQYCGINDDLTISTNMPQGLNALFRTAKSRIVMILPPNQFSLKYISSETTRSLFFNQIVEAGLSYTIQHDHGEIKPYVLGQWANIIQDLGKWEQGFELTEAIAGFHTSTKITNDFRVLTDFNYNQGFGEHGFQGDVRAIMGKEETFEIGLKGSKIISDYKFNEDKWTVGINGRIDAEKFFIDLGYGFAREGGENDEQFEVSASVKF
jgi:hypothetical protein